MNKTQTNKKELYLIIGVGILSMFFAEVLPEFSWWMPALSIGVCRAYIIINTPAVKVIDSGSAKWANAWMVGSTILVAAYIITLFKTGQIDANLHTSLHVANIMLVGAEWYYSKKNGAQVDALTIHHQKEIDSYQNKIDEKQKDFEALTNEHQLKIDTLQMKIDTHHTRIVSLESENKGLQAKIENLKTENEPLQKKAKAILKLIKKPVRLNKTTQAIICPHCLELQSISAAQKAVEHCGQIIWEKQTTKQL